MMHELLSTDFWTENVLDVHRYRFRPVPLTRVNEPIDTDMCKERCVYGICTKNWSDPYGCGGCCSCLGGCHADYERANSAPILWEGDDS